MTLATTTAEAEAEAAASFGPGTSAEPVTTSNFSWFQDANWNGTTTDGQLTDLHVGITTSGGGTGDIGIATILTGVILCVIVVLTFVGNILVVVAVANYRRLRNVTNYLLMSLAIADIMVASLVMPFSVVYEVMGVWDLGWVMCHFWISCDVMCCTASILHLCIISLDRYWAITIPLLYKVKMSRKRAISMVMICWVASALISFIPIFMGWYSDEPRSALYIDRRDCRLNVNATYAVVSSTTSFYLPLVIMLFAYAKVLRIAQRQAKEIRKMEDAVRHLNCNNHSENGNGSGHEEKKRVRRRSKKLNKDSKAIKTLGILMGLFCICWVPFFLMYVILPFCGEACPMPPRLDSFITWLGYANSLINPCIYVFVNRDFRNAFRKLLSCNNYFCDRFSCCKCKCCPVLISAATNRDSCCRKVVIPTCWKCFKRNQRASPHGGSGSGGSGNAQVISGRMQGNAVPTERQPVLIYTQKKMPGGLYDYIMEERKASDISMTLSNREDALKFRGSCQSEDSSV